MLCVESSLLIDALDSARDGHDNARRFLDSHRKRPLFIPTIFLWEGLRGPANHADADTVADTAGPLKFRFLQPFDGAAAREAVEVEAEQMTADDPLNVRDYAVAGTVRHYGERSSRGTTGSPR